MVFLDKIHIFLQTEEKTEVLIDRKMPTTCNYNTSTEAVKVKELYVSFGDQKCFILKYMVCRCQIVLWK